MSTDHDSRMNGADECSSCHEPILWGVTATGSRMPLDPEPRSDGNMIFEGDRLKYLSGHAREHYTGERYASHFATCPHSGRHRKTKEENDMGKSTKVGAFWIPTNKDSKAKLTGQIEINGLKVKCAMFSNKDWAEGSNKPKYVLLAFEAPTQSTQQRPQGQRSEQPKSGRRSAPRDTGPVPVPTPVADDEVI